EHEPAFAAALAAAGGGDGRAAVRFENVFSHQAPSTDTLAIGEDGAPFRHGGRLLLRPAGHGALIENLAGARGDLVAIKNIDNVQPLARRGPALTWARLLGGRLLELERAVHAWLGRLEDPNDTAAVWEALAFADATFGAAPGVGGDARARAWQRLHRPL